MALAFHCCVGRRVLIAALAAMCLAGAAGAAAPPEAPPPWAGADLSKPMTADEAKDFMQRLARYVFEHHMKKTPGSKQRGMVYEYLDTTRIGQFDQYIEGEALDTMHDGAWFAAAMVNACRATRDPFYKEVLADWQLPFYLLMLNHSDTLFSAKRNDARPGAFTFGKEHMLIEGEKGFVPYWWDDGASVSLERRVDKNPLGPFPCVDNFAGKPNPQGLLDGYSLGCSNHMAQDLGVMLELGWLLFREDASEKGRKLAAELAGAARNLYESRMRHHGPIPMCVAPTALAAGDARLLASVSDAAADFPARNHTTAALYDFVPGQKRPLPAFADDQQYLYYAAMARYGSKPPPGAAFRTVYDAYTEPMLWRYFYDDGPVPPGINRGEYGHDMHDGMFDYYHSDAKGVRFLGSRLGPQNMVTSAQALQLLRAFPGVWEERYKQKFPGDLRVTIDDPAPGAKAEPAPWADVTLGDATLRLKSTRLALLVEGKCPADALALKVFSRPDAKGTHAVITLKKGEAAVAANDKGEPLIVKGDAKAEGDGVAFSVELRYTVTKGQKPWANGIEHGRYSIQRGDAVRNLYLASPEPQVKAWLEREAGCGLRTWDAIFRRYGYIPTHIGRSAFWDGLSDTGGYAHLVSAAAEWVLYLDGKNDWEVHHVPVIGK
jgi:hypothetical protein